MLNVIIVRAKKFRPDDVKGRGPGGFEVIPLNPSDITAESMITLKVRLRRHRESSLSHQWPVTVIVKIRGNRCPDYLLSTISQEADTCYIDSSVREINQG